MALLRLQLQDALFHSVPRHQAIGEHRFVLADAVRTVDRLGFGRRVPPRVENEDIVGGGEVESDPPSFEADEEHLAVRIGLETFDAIIAVAGLTIEVFVGNALLLQSFLDDAEELRELGEDQRLVTGFAHFLEVFRQDFQLDALFASAFAVEKPRVTGELTQSQ